MANNMGSQIGIGIASSLLASAVTGGSVYAWRHRERATEYINQAKVYIRTVVPTPPEAEGTELANMVRQAEEGVALVLAASDGRTDLVRHQSGGAEDAIARILASQGAHGEVVTMVNAAESTERASTGGFGGSMASIGLSQSFILAEGIDREVISANIQKHLGADASVRPGARNDIPVYWIMAFRPLTNPMINDLKSDTLRWRQEQSRIGTKDPYVASSAHYAATARRPRQNYVPSPIAGSRIEHPPPRASVPHGGVPVSDRLPVSGSEPSPDRMEVDLPSKPRSHGESQLEGRPAYQMVHPISTTAYGRAPVAPVYGSAPGYAPNIQQSHDGPPSGYTRQGNYYVPIPAYEPAVVPPRGSEQQQYAPGYVQPPQMPSGRDPRDARDLRYLTDPRDPRDARDARDPRELGDSRDPREVRDPRDRRDPREMRDVREVRDPIGLRDPREARDPRDVRDPRYARYGGDLEYSEPRYAYPSPATTVAFIPARDREPAGPSSAPVSNTTGAYGQHSRFATHGRDEYVESSAYSTGVSALQYDQYSRPARMPSDARDSRNPSAKDPREAAHVLEREALAAAATTGRDTHRNVRRRER